MQPKNTTPQDWEKYINERIDFLYDHWTLGDDKKPFHFGGWREEVVSEIANKIALSRSQAQKELIEELKKIWEMSEAIYFRPPTTIEENKANGRKLEEINKYCANKLHSHTQEEEI